MIVGSTMVAPRLVLDLIAPKLRIGSRARRAPGDALTLFSSVAPPVDASSTFMEDCPAEA